jgi:lysophospholipase L1-like esterase
MRKILPNLLSILLFSGLITILSLVFLYDILSNFINLPVILTAFLATFTGFNLLLQQTLPRQQFRQLWQKLIIMAAGLLAGLIIIEVALHLLNPYPAYFVIRPNQRWQFNIDTGLMPGLEPNSTFTTNELGIRGDPYQADGRYNILTIGGSTTEVALLDDSKSWPYLLQRNLNQENGRPPYLDPNIPIWVGSIGRSGHGLVEHIHALQFFVPQYRFDAVILMVGVNDFQPIVQQPKLYNDQYEDPTNYTFYLHRSFHIRPLTDPNMTRPFPQNTAVFNLFDVSLWRLLSRTADEIAIEYPDVGVYERRRLNYQTAPELPGLPDLTPALTQYRDNLLLIVELAKQHNLRLILVTQPAIWHEELSPEIQQNLWLGFRGDFAVPDGRYSPTDLLQGLEQFNQVLLDICTQEKVECVDLTAEMNGQEKYFYDDIHFNVAGSDKVADLLNQSLTQSHNYPITQLHNYPLTQLHNR